MWKKKILPLLKPHYSKLNSLKIYLAVYHEAVVCNMLEVMLFHYTAVKESNEYLIEIIDYCYHKIANQINKCTAKRKKQRE